jgi:scyllo-inositol 2-dehydrogenase (NADP+)
METRIINTALCSFGMSGRVFHAPFINLHPGLNLYGVWERTKNLAAAKYPGVQTFRALETMLEDEAVELVIVNTPSVTHFEYAQKCLEAGKHVVVEKPFTATTQQARTLINLAAEKKKILSVYHNRRYDSDFRTIKKVLDNGWLGELVEVNIHYDRYVPVLSPKVHKETPTPAVGCLYDLGAHLIDQALNLFGMPLAVFADIAANRPGSLVDDYFDLKLFYPGFRVTLKSSYYVREALPGYQLHGKKGSFIKPKTDVQETQLQAGVLPGGDTWGTEPEAEWGLLHTEREGTVIREYIASEQGNYGDYYRILYNAIIQNKPAPVQPEEALRVIQIIEAAGNSNRERKVITLGHL